LLGKFVNLPDLKSADVIDLPDWRKRAPMRRSLRPLIRPHLLAAQQAFIAEARADLAAMNFQYQGELAELRRELAELREICHDVVVVLRQQADQDVATLRR
jgi:hypothetical protein